MNSLFLKIYSPNLIVCASFIPGRLTLFAREPVMTVAGV